MGLRPVSAWGFFNLTESPGSSGLALQQPLLLDRILHTQLNFHGQQDLSSQGHDHYEISSATPMEF